MSVKLVVSINSAIKNKRKALILLITKKDSIIIQKLIALGIVKYSKLGAGSKLKICLTNKALANSRVIKISDNNIHIRW